MAIRENSENPRTGPRRRLTSVYESTGFMGKINSIVGGMRRYLSVAMGTLALGTITPNFSGCQVTPNRPMRLMYGDAAMPDPDTENPEINPGVCDLHDYSGEFECRDGCVAVGFRCSDGSINDFDVCDPEDDFLCPDGSDPTSSLCIDLDCDNDERHEAMCGPGGRRVRSCPGEEGTTEVDFCSADFYDTRCPDGCYADHFCIQVDDGYEA